MLGCASTLRLPRPQPVEPTLPELEAPMPQEEVSVPNFIPDRDGNKPLVPIAHYNGVIDNNGEKFVDQLMTQAEAKKVDFVVIDINSVGGSMAAGFNIAKRIENSSVRVVCIADGEVDSMAFYILQSCDQRYMTKRSVLMIHNPLYSRNLEMASNDEIHNITDEADAQARAVMEHETAKMKIKPAELAKHIPGARQWWLDWKDAKKYGAVDGIVSSVPLALKDLREGKKIQTE